MDQSVETEDQQSGMQSETQTQASQDSVAAVRASQNGWVKAGDGGWYFYENGQLKTGWLYRNGNWYWLDPDRNGRMAENSWFTYDNNLLFPELGRHSEKCVSQHQWKNVLCTGKWYRCPWNSQNNEWTW